jgi:hypothetical protein
VSGKGIHLYLTAAPQTVTAFVNPFFQNAHAIQQQLGQQAPEGIPIFLKASALPWSFSIVARKPRRVVRSALPLFSL